MPAKRNIKTYTKEELIKSHAIIGSQKKLEDIVYLTEVKFKDESEDSFVKCLHCGAKFAQLDAHIKKFHNQTPKEYLIQFEGASLVCKNSKDRVSGDKNPAAGHGGLYSKFSDKFLKYDGLTQEEINLHKKDVANKSKETKKANPHNENTKIEYYTSRGYSEEDAIQQLSIRQSTFTLKKCVENYGEDLGKEIWTNRQDEWLYSYKTSNYSRISQKLFWEICKEDFRYLEAKFAENINGTKKLDSDTTNYEAVVSGLKPDFLYKNKIIEFDGVYWHNSVANPMRESFRDERLIEVGYEVFHISETDYLENPQIEVSKCLNFLKQ